MNRYMSISLLAYSNTPIPKAQLYALVITMKHQMLPTDTYNLNNICLLWNHKTNPSSQYNHQDKLFITCIVNILRISHRNITKPQSFSLRKHCWKQQGQYIHQTRSIKSLHCINPFLHETLYWPSIPMTSTQNDGLVHNLKKYIEKKT